MPRPKSKTLTEAELRLMEVLWDRGEATVADVAKALPAKLDLAYNTVLTTLRILEEKGYVRHRKPREARAFIYRPKVARDQAARSAVRELVHRFFGRSHEALVLNLLDNEELGEGERQRIRNLLGQLDKEAKP